jgi:ribosomal protein S18 acetylase RimI-like enzyme
VPSSPESHTPPRPPEPPIVRPAETADIPALRAFLERYRETSLFLLSNLDGPGILLSSLPTSGNVLLIEEGGGLAGVFCLTRKGDLLAQTGGREDLAPSILRGCDAESFPITGVIAEWRVAESVWRELMARRGFAPVYRSKSVVYHLDGLPAPGPVPPGIEIRALTVDDYDLWEPVDRAFHDEEGLAVAADPDRRRAGYAARAAVSGWWGAFAGARLLSTACVNAVYRGAAQVGGVYTRPDHRRRGLARRVMCELMRQHRDRQDVREMVLFTAEQNMPARALYEAMGFTERGRFGLLFGRWNEA